MEGWMGRPLAVFIVASALIGVGATGSPAAATATAPSFFTRAVAWDFREPICDTGQSSAPVSNCSQTNVTTATGIRVEGDASSTAGLADGVLNASASSSGAYSGGQEGEGEALATVFDTLTFHGFSPGDNAVVTMSAVTAFSTPFFSGPPGDSFGVGSGFIAMEGLDTFGHEVALADDCSPNVDNRFCFTLKEGNAVISNVGNVYSITETFSLSQNPTLGLRLDVGAHAVGDASASVEDPITITLPSGVTYTSASGLFLTGAVPEPATWASLMVGLGAIGLVLRRRAAPVRA
jgi:hypothetical protein